MKKLICIVISTILALLITSSIVEARSYRSSSSDVHVNGYYRSNGTYVAPYYRTPPDSTKLNNYWCIDDGNCGDGYDSSSYYPYTSYPDSTTTYQPSCWYNQYLWTDGSCYCDAWYTINSSKSACELKTVYNSCPNYGMDEYLWADGTCYCNAWYTWSDTDNKCESRSDSCYWSYWIGAVDNWNGWCKCDTWYVLNSSQSGCEVKTVYNYCPNYGLNEYLWADWSCYCSTWYYWNKRTAQCAKRN